MAWGYAKGFIIEYDSTKKKKGKSCSKCIYYVKEDKSCEKQPVYVPDVGYGFCKSCSYYEEESDDYEEEEIPIINKAKAVVDKPKEGLDKVFICSLVTNKGRYRLYSYSGKMNNALSGEYVNCLIKIKNKKGDDVQLPSYISEKKREIVMNDSFVKDHLNALMDQILVL